MWTVTAVRRSQVCSQLSDLFNCGHQRCLTMNTLSDDILLCVFDSYRQLEESEGAGGEWPWHVLAHVCQRWRRIIFAYPAHLNLQIVCKSRTDAKAALEFWPAVPISISARFDEDGIEDDIIGALEYRDRITMIDLDGLTSSRVEKCVALMKETFPILTSLFLMTYPSEEGVFSTLMRSWVDPPLVSSRDLVDLTLGDIPILGSGHISPETMGTCLSALIKLRSFSVYFKLDESYPYPISKDPHPSRLTPIQVVLPVLTDISLSGPHVYLDDLMARVDAPLLKSVFLHLYDQPTLGSPQLPHFIHRTQRLKSPGRVDVYLHHHEGAFLDFYPLVGSAKFKFLLRFPFNRSHTPVELLEQISTQYSALLSHVEWLTIGRADVYFGWWLANYPTAWLVFLRPFIAVQTLYFSGEEVLPHLALMLGKLTGKGVVEVLPSLHTIRLWGSPSDRDIRKATCLLEPFISAREHYEHPVALEYEEDL